MEEYKEDLKQFASNNKFQWYTFIIFISVILVVIGYIPKEQFTTMFERITMSLFVAEGLDQFSNKRTL